VRRRDRRGDPSRARGSGLEDQGSDAAPGGEAGRCPAAGAAARRGTALGGRRRTAGAAKTSRRFGGVGDAQRLEGSRGAEGAAVENVIVCAYVHAASEHDARGVAQEALVQAGLDADAQLLAGGLPKKQLRLLELARALAGKPKVLLLDETLAGLGGAEVDEM